MSGVATPAGDHRAWSHLPFLPALDLEGLPGGGFCALSSHPQEVAELIRRHKALMTCVLEDPLLVTLRLDGGTMLARLRREEHGSSEDGR